MAKKSRKKKRMFRFLLFVLLVIVIAVVSIIIYFKNVNNSNIDIVLVDNLDVEVNSEVMVSSLIDSISNGVLIDEDQIVDTSKLGKNKITIKLKNEKDKEEDYSFEINVVDTEKPIIDCENKIVITVGDEVDLLSYVTVSDNYDKDFHVSINGEYDFNTIGEYNLSYVVKDSSGNEEEKSFILVVEKSKYRKMSDKTITTSKGYTLKIKNGLAYIDDVLIVNKTYYLPENYTPKNSYATLSDSCINCLEVEVMNAFNEMKGEASSIGLNIYIASYTIILFIYALTLMMQVIKISYLEVSFPKRFHCFI